MLFYFLEPDWWSSLYILWGWSWCLIAPSWSSWHSSLCQCLWVIPHEWKILSRIKKNKIDPTKMPATTLKSPSSDLYATGRMWIMVSPSKAPNARLNRDLIVISKQPSEAKFLQNTMTIAVINPIRETPSPAKNPNPHRSGTVIMWLYSACSSPCSSACSSVWSSYATDLVSWQLMKAMSNVRIRSK